MRSKSTGLVAALGCAVAAYASATACGGDSFSPDGAARGGGVMTDGGSDGGGEGGTTATGGSAGRPGTSGSTATGGGGSGGGGEGGQGEAGAAGEPSCATGSTCRDGRYCSAEGACRRCTDITSLDDPRDAHFGTPEPLSVLNDAAGDWFLRSPRAFGSDGALLYVRDFFGGEIWFTGDAETSVGAPLSSPVNDPDFLESSPLWLGGDDTPFAPRNFVFNRAAGLNQPNELHAARLDANGGVSDMMRLPAPFNPSQPLAESTYSMAVSRDRAWWMVNRDLMLALQFLTAPIDQAGPPSVVSLRLSEACSVVEFDLGPWVSADGKLLFVNSVERSDDCTPLSGEPKDIVMFRLDEGGQPRGFGVPLSDVSRPEQNELDASFSPDMCTVYFVTLVGDKLRLMKARRER